MKSKLSYTSLLQKFPPLAGIVSGLVGFLSVQVTNHVGLLGSVGFSAPQITAAKHYVHGALASASSVSTVSQSPIGHAIFSGIVFLAGTAATYAAHHKWLDNLAYWWKHQETIAAAPVPLQLNSGTTGFPVIASGPKVGSYAEPLPEPEGTGGQEWLAARQPSILAPDPTPAATPEPAPEPSPQPATPPEPLPPSIADQLRAQIKAAGLPPAA